MKNNNRNLIINTMKAIGFGIVVLLVGFLLIKGNEISALFYAFLDSVVGFVPYVVGAVILYNLGAYNATKKYQDETEDHEIENDRLHRENKKMANYLNQAISQIEDDNATIEALRAELQKHNVSHLMSQIEDIPGDDTANHSSDLQSTAE